MSTVVYAAPGHELLAENVRHLIGGKHYNISWDTFPDGTDNIYIEGLHPTNELEGKHVVFIASCLGQDVMRQLHVMVVLLESFIESFTVVIPYYPVGTMERVDKEGTVATANTMARILSGLPSCGRPTRILIFDLHTLQNRFYFHGNAISRLESIVPHMLERPVFGGILRGHDIAFPDAGAAKRYRHYFEGFNIIICSKERVGDQRVIRIVEGDINPDKEILIVDDIIQSGGTILQCVKQLKQQGAKQVSAFCCHPVFSIPDEALPKFNVLHELFVGDTIPGASERLRRLLSIPVMHVTLAHPIARILVGNARQE